MHKEMFSLLILIAFAFALAVPTAPVAAGGATHTHFTAVAFSTCFSDQPDPRCSFGEISPLPNGKTAVRNFVNVVRITAEDDRYTGTAVVTLHMLAPGTTQLFPFQGTWKLVPDNYDGYWEGTISERVTQDGEYAELTGKGYGALKGLLLMEKVRGGVYHDVEIIQLPGYVP
jgi:hypothetical protein